MIKESVKEDIDVIQLFEMTSPKKHFREIKYFSTDGSTMPNGIGYQRGHFIHECKVNAEKFILP